jgi:hypothetical protein
MKQQIQPAREEVSVPAEERTSTSRSAWGAPRFKRHSPASGDGSPNSEPWPNAAHGWFPALVKTG